MVSTKLQPSDWKGAMRALAEAMHLLPVGAEHLVAKIWLQHALRDRLEGRAATLDEALGLPAPQPRQVRAAERHALIRDVAAATGLRGWAAAGETERILAGEVPAPPAAQAAVARLRAERYAIKQRQILRACGTDTTMTVCVSSSTLDSMQASARKRTKAG